jgi:hypothetical protein
MLPELLGKIPPVTQRGTDNLLFAPGVDDVRGRVVRQSSRQPSDAALLGNGKAPDLPATFPRTGLMADRCADLLLALGVAGVCITPAPAPVIASAMMDLNVLLHVRGGSFSRAGAVPFPCTARAAGRFSGHKRFLKKVLHCL